MDLALEVLTKQDVPLFLFLRPLPWFFPIRHGLFAIPVLFPPFDELCPVRVEYAVCPPLLYFDEHSFDVLNPPVGLSKRRP